MFFLIRNNHSVLKQTSERFFTLKTLISSDKCILFTLGAFPVTYNLLQISQIRTWIVCYIEFPFSKQTWPHWPGLCEVQLVFLLKKVGIRKYFDKFHLHTFAHVISSIWILSCQISSLDLLAFYKSPASISLSYICISQFPSSVPTITAK